MNKSIQVDLPAEIEAFVRDQIAVGAAVDEGAVVLTALELYRRMKSNHESLKTLVQESLEEAERGELQALDTEATKAEARRRLSASNLP